TAPGSRPCFPGWTLLRRLGGEIVEVSGFAAAEEVTTDQVVLVQGRFASGALFSTRYLPQQLPAPAAIEVIVHTEAGEPLVSVLLCFLRLQLLRWLVPTPPRSDRPRPPES